MKKKIPIYILLKAFGIPDKKLIHTLEKERFLKFIQKTTKIKVSKSISKIYEIIVGKEVNLLRFKKLL